MFAAALLAAGWLDDFNNISKQVMSTGKASAAALVVVFMLVAYAAKRTVGAVIAAGIVGGLVLWVVNNTDILQKKTQDTINNTGAPAALGGTPAGGHGSFTAADGSTVTF